MKIIEQGHCGNHRKPLNPPLNGRYISPLLDCPLCGKHKSCDMWTAEVDDDWSPDYPKPVWSETMASSSIKGHGYTKSDVNVYPGTILSAHKNVLFIFLDHPKSFPSPDDLCTYVNGRIREHICGDLTLELRIVTQDKFSLFDFFGWKSNRRTNALINRWREVDSSFAPTISFENYIGKSI